MRVYNRSFDEAQKDYQKMWVFLVDDYNNKKDHFIWTIGRLGDWPNSVSKGFGHFPYYLRDNARLWFNSIEELIGFTISENGNANFYALAKRGHEFIYSEMVEWVKLNWRDREGQLCTQVDENQHVFMQVLEKLGFKKGDVSEVSRQYIYAQNQDGLVVANCNAFVDYKNNYAEIERVCTHSKYRKRGLAQAVIIECMRRLRDEGLKYAYIGGSSEEAISLYGKFESTSCRNWYEFKLNS